MLAHLKSDPRYEQDNDQKKKQTGPDPGKESGNNQTSVSPSPLCVSLDCVVVKEGDRRRQPYVLLTVNHSTQVEGRPASCTFTTLYFTTPKPSVPTPDSGCLQTRDHSKLKTENQTSNRCWSKVLARERRQRRGWCQSWQWRIYVGGLAPYEIKHLQPIATLSSKCKYVC